MKLLKLTSLTLVVGAALAAYNAQAVSVTMYSSPLNFSGTITTNTPEKSSGDSWNTGTKTSKYGNKQLLDLFAAWNGIEDRSTNSDWKSAKLVIGWDWSYDVLVVDKTGTNVLFDATEGAGGGSAYFLVDFFDEYGVGKESGKEADPGFYSVTDTGTADYELYDDFYLPSTDVYGTGGNTQKFKQTWDANDDGKTWNDSENAQFLYSGNQSFMNMPTTDITSTAKAKANGKGKGYNYIGWAD